MPCLLRSVEWDRGIRMMYRYCAIPHTCVHQTTFVWETKVCMKINRRLAIRPNPRKSFNHCSLNSTNSTNVYQFRSQEGNRYSEDKTLSLTSALPLYTGTKRYRFLPVVYYLVFNINRPWLFLTYMYCIYLKVQAINM